MVSWSNVVDFLVNSVVFVVLIAVSDLGIDDRYFLAHSGHGDFAGLDMKGLRLIHSYEGNQTGRRRERK